MLRISRTPTISARALIPAVVIILVAVGCSASPAECTGDGDCAPGEECQQQEGLFSADGICVDRDGETDSANKCPESECAPDETCYRGVCYSVCDDDADCDADDGCFQRRCQPTSCEGIDCFDGEECYRGVCYEACDEDADCDAEELCVEDARCMEPDCSEVNCKDAETCYRGVCYSPCPLDQDRCGADCVDTSTDSDHCGECDTSCENGDVCRNGECVSGGECDDDSDCEDDGICVDSFCATGPFVYAGIDATVEPLVFKLGSERELIWSFDGHSDVVMDIAVDPDGYVYSASSDHTVRKLSPEGEEIWVYDEHTDRVRAVAVDGDGYVYSASTDGTTHKISLNGQTEWIFDDRTPMDIAVGGDGRVHVGTYVGYNPSGTIWTVDDTGEVIWMAEGETVQRVAVAPDGDVYSGGWNPPTTMRRFSPDGIQQWESEESEGQFSDVATGRWMEETHLYAVTAGTTDPSVDGSKMYKKDSSGELVWDKLVEDAVFWAVAGDTEGNLYIADRGGVHRYAPDGQREWTYSVDTEETVTAVAVDPGAYGAFPEAW